MSSSSSSSSSSHLLAPDVHASLLQRLYESHASKERRRDWWLNIGIFVALLAGVGAWLQYSYKGKLTPEEKHNKDQAARAYVLEKIQAFETAKRRAHQDLITNLPAW